MAKWLKIIFVLVVVGILLAAVKVFDLQQGFRDVLEWISGLGWFGVLVFILLYIVVCVLVLPGFILTMGAGVLFGVVKGSIVVSIGSILGATCAFLVGRYLTRNWVSAKISGNEKFLAIDQAVAEQGWKIVLLTRLSPVFPYNLLNYAYGLTKVSLKDYFFASWVGMMPVTVMYVYIGSVAGDLTKLSAGQRERTTGEWIMYGVGLLATLVVAVFVTRTAKRALGKTVTGV